MLHKPFYFNGGLFSYFSQTKATGELVFPSMSNLEKEEPWKISRSQLKFMCHCDCLLFFPLRSKVYHWWDFLFTKIEYSSSRKRNTKQLFTKSSDTHLVFPLVPF